MSFGLDGPGAVGPEPTLRLLRRPWVSDPIFWVGVVVAVVFGVVAALTIAQSQQGGNFAQVALAGLFSAVVWWALATFVPAGIRLLILRRRRTALLERRPPSLEPGWYPDPTDLTRYRWWGGSAWGTEVSPAPSNPAVGSAGLVVLGIAAAAVVVGSFLLVPAPVNPAAGSEIDAATAEKILEDLQTYMPTPDELQDELASQFPSPSPEPRAAFDPQLTEDLAKAYGRMAEAFHKANKLNPKPGETAADLVNTYGRKVSEATDEWKKFNSLLGQVRSQEQIGDYPPLELLRRVEGSVSRYLNTAEQISRSFYMCLTVPDAETASCIESSQAMYEGSSQREFEEVGKAIKALAEARQGQQS